MTHPFRELVLDIWRQPNAISTSAYDMAWMAWLMPAARDWLCDAQRPDGSWGAELEYYHDRVLSTLAAVNALAATSTNGQDMQRIERGIRYLETAALRLPEDPADTVGFELLAPALVSTGQGLGLKLDEVAHALEPYQAIYRQKMALIPPQMLYSPSATVAHSLEFIGFERLDRAAIAPLRLANGSVHCSPAATAFCQAAGAGSAAGQDYLSATLEHGRGGVPTLAPFELFEIIWSLLHVYIAGGLADHQVQNGTRTNADEHGRKEEKISVHPRSSISDPLEVQPLLDRLQAAWGPEGIGLAEGFPPDFDNTASAYMLLAALGQAPDPAVFKAYEEADHFRCYRYERNISLDVHIHLVMALRRAPDFPGNDDMLLKAINILSRHLQSKSITDKWHVSPYYSTAHAVIALNGLVADSLIADQIRWLCRTQQDDGHWTAYPHFPPAAVEETAHALLALLVVQKQRGSIPHDIIQRGMAYLKAHYNDHNALPALWVGKGLYHPLHITRSIFLAAFTLYDELY